MFTQIVVLFVCYLLELPTWCKVFMFIAIGVNLMRFGYGICKGFNKLD